MISNGDISEEEEANLPTPPGWVKALAPGGQELSYRDSRTGAESHEHPYIIAASNAASKLALPEGWSAKVIVLDNGAEDTFYRHDKEGVSMWDHPLLRQCLSSVLIDEGYSREAEVILGDLSGDQELSDPPDLKENVDAVHKSYDEFRKVEAELEQNEQIGRKKSNYLHNKDEEESALTDKNAIVDHVRDLAREGESVGPEAFSAIDKRVSFHKKVNNHDSQEPKSMHELPSTPGSLFARASLGGNKGIDGGVVTLDLGGSGEQDVVENLTWADVDRTGTPSKLMNKGATDAFRSLSHEGERTHTVGQRGGTKLPEDYNSSHTSMWEAYKEETIKEDEHKRRFERHSHSTNATKPPRSLTGVKVLTQDARAANERVQELLIQIRAKLSESEGIPCRVMQEDEEGETPIDLVGIPASDGARDETTIEEEQEEELDTTTETKYPREAGSTKRFRIWRLWAQVY